MTPLASRADALLAALRIEGAAADQLRPQVLDLLRQVRADAFDDAARMTRPSAIDRTRMDPAAVRELESLTATFDAGARVTRQGRSWPR